FRSHLRSAAGDLAKAEGASLEDAFGQDRDAPRQEQEISVSRRTAGLHRTLGAAADRYNREVAIVRDGGPCRVGPCTATATGVREALDGRKWAACALHGGYPLLLKELSEGKR